jgi:hypothetical protein
MIGGGETRPYPWRDVRPVRHRLLRGRRLRQLALVGIPIGALLSPIALIALAWAWRGYLRRNDSWRMRPAITFLLGAVLTLITFRPQDWLRRSREVLAGTVEWSTAIVHVLLGAAGPALVLAALSSAGFCYAYEWSAHRYLDKTRPTPAMQARRSRNVRKLRTVGPADGRVRFGVIVDDPIPWRTPRHGMVFERRIADLGHGLIVGGTGTGTTVTAVTLADQAVTANVSVVYLDCDGSAETKTRLRAVAELNQVPFTSFDLGVGGGHSSWYDPLSWPGPASEKASALLDALGYRDDREPLAALAQAWLDLQYEVMDEVGLRPDESRFDFLVQTCDPIRLHRRFADYEYGTADQQRLYEHWNAQLTTFSPEAVAAINEDLTTLINAAGPRLRPAHPGDEPLRLTSLGAGAGIVHIGLGAASDGEAVRQLLGALVLKDLAALAELGRREATGERPDLFVIIDPSNRLGERMTLSEQLIIEGEASGIRCWPVARSLADLPASTAEAFRTAARTVIIHRVTDVATADRLSGWVGDVPSIAGTMAGGSGRRAGLFGDGTNASGSEIRGLSDAPLVGVDLMWSLPDHHAFVIIDGSSSTALRDGWSSRRVHGDEINVDAPQVLVVPRVEVLQPPPIKDAPAPAFVDLVAPAAELTTVILDQGEVPLSEAQQRRLAEYKARRAGQTQMAAAEADWIAVPADPIEDEWGEWVPADELEAASQRQFRDQQADSLAAATVGGQPRPATKAAGGPTDDPIASHDGQREATPDATEGSDRYPELDPGDEAERSRDLAIDLSETPILEAPPDDGTARRSPGRTRERTTRRATAQETAAGKEPR